MPFDPNVIAGSPFATLVLALTFLALVVGGVLVPKSTLNREQEITDKALGSNDKALAAIDRLTAAVDAWRSVERREGPR